MRGLATGKEKALVNITRSSYSSADKNTFCIFLVFILSFKTSSAVYPLLSPAFQGKKDNRYRFDSKRHFVVYLQGSTEEEMKSWIDAISKFASLRNRSSSEPV